MAYTLNIYTFFRSIKLCVSTTLRNKSHRTQEWCTREHTSYSAPGTPIYNYIWSARAYLISHVLCGAATFVTTKWQRRQRAEDGGKKRNFSASPKADTRAITQSEKWSCILISYNKNKNLPNLNKREQKEEESYVICPFIPENLFFFFFYLC